MKKIVLLMGILLLIPFAAAKLDRDCFTNYTQLACGVENWPPNASFCEDIELNVTDCYNDGENFYATFTGISDFTIKELYRGLTFDLYSRTRVWKGSIAITSPEAGFDVLPTGAVISKTDSEYLFYAPIGNYSITGFQITVPYCYKIEDSDGVKTYLRTQAGKSCYVKKQEAVVEAPIAEEKEVIAPPEVEKKDWTLLLTIILVIIVVVLLFAPRKKLKKAKK